VFGNQRQNKDRLQRKIPVADGVETVGRNPIKPQSGSNIVSVDRQTRSGQGGGAQRRNIDAPATIGQPQPIALELLAIRQPIVRRKHWLSSLEMGIAWENHVEIDVAPANKRPLKVLEPVVNLVDCLPNPKPQIRRDLIVSAPRRVQFSTNVADPIDQRPFDMHVDVFEFRSKRKPALLNFLADLEQPLLNLLALGVGNQTRLRKHLGMGLRAFDVLGIQTLVEAHTLSELLDTLIRRLIEYATPRFVGHLTPPSKIPKIRKKLILCAVPNDANRYGMEEFRIIPGCAQYMSYHCKGGGKGCQRRTPRECCCYSATRAIQQQATGMDTTDQQTVEQGNIFTADVVQYLMA
jgi:hypothetical protein